MSQRRHNFFEDLPLELLYHLVTFLGLQSNDDRQTRQFSSVCSAFRRAIINTQELYELILINLDGKNGDGACKWLQLKVERSEPSRNLCVGLTGRKETSFVGPILDIALGCCERWGLLNIAVHPVALDRLLRPVEGRLHSLRKLRFSPLLMERESRWRQVVIPPFFRDLPLLEEVSVFGFPARNWLLLPLHRVTTCCVALPSDAKEVEAALEVLLHPESQLKNLVIQMHPEGTTGWGGSSPYHAPHLLNLQVTPDPYGDHVQQSRDCTKILDKLTAPSLKSLSVWIDNISSTTYLRLAERSKWAPESFKIYGSSPFNDIVSLFSLSSSLTKLLLQIDDLTCLREFPQFRDPTFLPNLSEWRLVVAWFRDNDGQSMAAHLFSPNGEVDDLTFLDDIGVARCELRLPSITSSGQPGSSSPQSLSFEIDLQEMSIAKETARLFARLPLENLNLDMEVLNMLKKRRPTLEGLWRDEDAEVFCADMSELFAMFEKVNNAQYLYHSGIHFVFDKFVILMTTKQVYFEDSPYHTDSPILKAVKVMLKHCLDLLLEDIPRIRWRFDGARSLIYTPDHHEYKAERNVFQVYFGR